ncbi:MAG: hypothetical protein JJU28_22605 [Cyclobacteriaceae bacterium]|nr:hypothetical protein [Cyclobacteriaceae bacterium]
MKKIFLRGKVLFIILSISSLFSEVFAEQPVSFRGANLLVSASVESPVRETLLRMLQEEISERSGQNLRIRDSWQGSANTIAIALSGDETLYGRDLPESASELKAEGFRVLSIKEGNAHAIWIIGADTRGALFGAGWLLRNLRLERNRISIQLPVDIQSAPVYPIRGHQIGYRTAANTFDAWSVEQYEKYIRELVIFGTNAIESIPIDDDNANAISVHMKIKPGEMNTRMSEICHKYGIDFWAWTPATFDLRDQAKRKTELEKHEKFYKSCVRLDHIFFPGGDPGKNHPREVMPYLRDLHQILTKYHPHAGMWISLQGFSVEQVDYFYRYLDEHQPTWLMGVVTGPSSPSVSETRFRLPSQYKHRHYPDITHTIRCDYPVENWDQAYALTLGREPVNPQPYYYAGIHASLAPFTDGFVSYSDGSTDNVNKIVWSMRGWNPALPVDEIMTQYARYFFGPGLENDGAAGIFALEKNWDGPLTANGGVETTLAFWKQLEKENPALNRNNWRWQMMLMRAYYDAYTRRRLIYEESLEREANAILEKAGEYGAAKAMALALAKVNEADTKPIATDLRKRIEELFEDLFRTIGLQSSVPKYDASGYERGASLDFVDYPLNNRWWLADQFENLGKSGTEEERLTRIKTISSWENPGMGSYYDDISNIRKGPRVTTRSYDATDVAWWDNGFSRERLSFQLFQKSPVIEYDHLNPGARYHIRVCGEGDALIRVDGVRLEPILYNKEKGSFKEWIVPLELSRKGKIKVTFDVPEESQLNWRQHSKISDIWLLKVNP